MYMKLLVIAREVVLNSTPGTVLMSSYWLSRFTSLDEKSLRQGYHVTRKLLEPVRSGVWSVCS